MSQVQNAFLLSHQPPRNSFFISEFSLLGRDPTCSVIINSEQVAERHCKIERKSFGYSIIDLRTESGTYVNSTKVIEAYLQEGDEISIGDNQFTFTLKPERPAQDFGLKSKNMAWCQQLSILSNIAKTNFPVLILGPSGTGKELMCESIHQQSSRVNGPLVKVNCSALTETLVESELFGHIKGSFTGAIADRKGAFEAARGGTLFLDEVGDLPMALQAKLLRAIENEEIRSVGSDKNIKTDVRILAATHHNLKSKIQSGEFRLDLYFRLGVITISPPALASRMEDFDDLLYSFAKKMRVRFSFAAIQKMKKHSWPGNIRELRNSVARASAFYPRMSIEEHHVDKIIDSTSFDPGMVGITQAGQLPVIKEIERQMILKRLAANNGNQRKTAVDLGIPKSTLHDRLRAYNIDPRQFSENA